MRVALVNPPWTFEGSIYFGCRAPHLPLELGYAAALLRAAGHEPRIFDGQLFGHSLDALTGLVDRFDPELCVIPTAPSYLFWRCAPPELRVPMAAVRALRRPGRLLVAVGPHGSTTPRTTLKKLGVDAVVMGECEEVLVRLASTPRPRWSEVESIAHGSGEAVRVQGGPASVDLAALAPLAWDDAFVAAHDHHHHRFDRTPEGPGAEVEASRGCPHHCTFCAKDDHRDRFRRRPVDAVLEEIDRLLAQGVRYLYFIDEIFLPERSLLDGLARREVEFGVQLRVDNWSEEELDLLGRAGCVSIEAGVESITERGRSLLAKRCKATTAELSALLVHAKKRVPFVQANLIDAGTDAPADVAAWRDHLREHGIWANEPVPMFPYPGSPAYSARWGAPDEGAWERAHAEYLAAFDKMSDIQESGPLPLGELERGADG